MTQSAQEETPEAMSESNWKSFLNQFDLSTSELNEMITQKILVQKSIASRLKLARNQIDNKAKSAHADVDTEKIISEWLKQLRARYQVQMFSQDSSS